MRMHYDFDEDACDFDEDAYDFDKIAKMLESFVLSLLNVHLLGTIDPSTCPATKRQTRLDGVTLAFLKLLELQKLQKNL